MAIPLSPSPLLFSHFPSFKNVNNVEIFRPFMWIFHIVYLELLQKARECSCTVSINVARLSFCFVMQKDVHSAHNGIEGLSTEFSS